MTTVNKKKIIWKALKKQLKTRKLVLIILLLVANSTAWFIYSQEVSSGVSAHVRYWKILFEAGDSPIIDYVDIEIPAMYPGMDTYSNIIKAYNHSEVSAALTYTLLNANLMGDEIITKEGKLYEKLELTGDELTSDELVTKLASGEYPFKINVNLSSMQMDPEYGEATFSITVDWPFESGNDELDTLWGNKAYDYKESTSSGTPSITMKVRIYIFQSNEEESSDPESDTESSNEAVSST